MTGLHGNIVNPALSICLIVDLEITVFFREALAQASVAGVRGPGHHW
jgi:hypothetical protein